MSETVSVRLELDLQIATRATSLPEAAAFERWAAAALEGRRARAALTIRVAGTEEATILNRVYRGRDGPTNVLSFPFELPPGVDPRDPIAELIGDLVICADVVEREALAQRKAAPAHWAHMVVHGVLHLLDYDHLTEPDAARMESLETQILGGLGFPTPYETGAVRSG